MNRLVLWYREPGTPFLAVSGLTLLMRAVLTAQKAGLERVDIVAPEADHAGIRAALQADKRVKIGWSVGDAEVADTLVALGDRVFLKDALDALLALDGPGVINGVARVHEPVSVDALGSLPAVPPPKPCVAVVRGPQDVPAAEVMLVKSLTKKADGVVARNINRKISGPISRRLAPYPVSPNMVTAVVAAIGIASGPLNAWGTYWGFVLGGFCYYLSAILDGVDGELSRLKFLSSPVGAWLDTITDDVVGTSYLVGLFYGLNRYADHPWWGYAGVACIAFYLLTILPRYWLLIFVVGSGDHQVIAAQRLAEEKGGFGKLVDAVASTIFRLDFLCFAAFVLSVVGAPWIYAGGLAIGTAMSFVETIYTVVKVRREAATA